jgi:peptidylprolyl isomerase
MNRGLPIAFLICIALVPVGCGGDESSGGGSEPTENSFPKRKEPIVVPPKGKPPKTLVKKDLIEGTGAVARTGDEVTIQYVGAGYESGIEFDSSWKSGKPFTFTLGRGKVTKGWEDGIPGMRVGGRRELIMPPQYAYGSKGAKITGSGRHFTIVPGATLVYVIDLFAVK